MKALTFKRYGKSPEIGFADVPRPTLKADDMLVQVHAASVNPVDNMIPTGLFKAVVKFQLPATLGSDLAGVVIEVGNRVTRFKPGVQAGQKVFIPAGSGGVGTFAIQLAKRLGAQVGTTTSTGNVELVHGLGADEVVDYRKQAFETVLRGYDAVLGTVRGDVIEKAIGILKPRGRIVSLVGPLDVAFARARRLNVFLRFVFALMSRRIMGLASKRGVDYSFVFARPDGDQLARIGKLIETQRIRPVIDKVLPFEQAEEALEYLAQGRARGKVVVQMR